MRLLLDTHTLVWYYQGDPKLGAAAIQAIQDPNNGILVSPASYWEVALKISVQKPILQVPYAVFIQEAIHDNGFSILPVEPRHTAVIATLPFHHKDPFDRLLVAQALSEGVPLISGDPTLDHYGIQRIW